MAQAGNRQGTWRLHCQLVWKRPMVLCHADCAHRTAHPLLHSLPRCTAQVEHRAIHVERTGTCFLRRPEFNGTAISGNHSAHSATSAQEVVQDFYLDLSFLRTESAAVRTEDSSCEICKEEALCLLLCIHLSLTRSYFSPLTCGAALHPALIASKKLLLSTMHPTKSLIQALSH